jgi:hypothetical protein
MNRKSLISILSFLHLFQAAIIYNWTPIKCPDIEIDPCWCKYAFYSRDIKCDGNELFNLTEISQKISIYYNNSMDDDKNFNELILSNTAIIELDENSLQDITYGSISIGGVFSPDMKLRRIHEKAFSSSLEIIDFFVIHVSNF